MLGNEELVKSSSQRRKMKRLLEMLQEGKIAAPKIALEGQEHKLVGSKRRRVQNEDNVDVDMSYTYDDQSGTFITS